MSAPFYLGQRLNWFARDCADSIDFSLGLISRLGYLVGFLIINCISVSRLINRHRHRQEIDLFELSSLPPLPMADGTYKAKSKKPPVRRARRPAPVAVEPQPVPATSFTPHVLSTENRLGYTGADMPVDPARPWYAYDFVDPGPKYRVRPEGFTLDYIEEGGEAEAATIIEEYRRDLVPVIVPGYQ